MLVFQTTRLSFLLGFVAPGHYVMDTDITKVNFKKALLPEWEAVASGRSIADDQIEYFPPPDDDRKFEGGDFLHAFCKAAGQMEQLGRFKQCRA